MAHECPTCGTACYCGGDIDDILLPDRAAENACEHCDSDDFDDDPDPDDEDLAEMEEDD